MYFTIRERFLERPDKRDFAIEKSIVQNAFLTRGINPTVVIAAGSAHLESRSRARCADSLSYGSGRANEWRSGVAIVVVILARLGKREAQAQERSPYGRFGDAAGSKHGGSCAAMRLHVITPSSLISYVSFLYVTAATMYGRRIRPRKSFPSSARLIRFARRLLSTRGCYATAAAYRFRTGCIAMATDVFPWKWETWIKNQIRKKMMTTRSGQYFT